GGGTRLRRAEPGAAGEVLRPAAVAAAAQAAPHGGRLRPLLPAGARLSRRGPPWGSAAGAHADRYRDELRGGGGRDGDGRGDGDRGQPRGAPGAADHEEPIPAADLRRGDEQIWIGQAGPALRDGAGRTGRSGCGGGYTYCHGSGYV